jgi:hypothetical protein
MEADLKTRPLSILEAWWSLAKWLTMQRASLENPRLWLSCPSQSRLNPGNSVLVMRRGPLFWLGAH